MIKRMFFLSFMASAIGIPYLLSSSGELLSSVKSKFTGSSSSGAALAAAKTEATAATDPLDPEFGAVAPRPGFDLSGKPKPIEGLGAQDLAQVLHFDGTPGWVMARWPRVTSGLAQLDLQGYRVPLVTGTAENDLAGSLTYYFDKEQHVKYITFQGATGDPRKLIDLVTRKYNFKPEPTNDPGLSLYLVKWNGRPMSELRIRPARVLRADQPNARFHIELAMMRQ
jgi:hypothetical protein